MNIQKMLSLLLALGLLAAPLAAAEEAAEEPAQTYDEAAPETAPEAESAPVEAEGEEIELSLGGDAPLTEPEEIPDAVDEFEQWDEGDYVLDYPDVTAKSVRKVFVASQRVYPGTLIWPLKGRTPLMGLSSHVGWRNAARIHSHQGGAWPSWLHHGIDVGGVSTGQMVVAASGGLAYAGEKKGLGKYVVIDHGNGWYTRCQHLSRYAGDVTADCRGVRVEAGDPIGYVGSSGGDYPVHFHFEIAYSPDGPGGTDADYQRETHNFRVRAYSFPQQATILLRWADRWEICSAENMTYITITDAPEEEAAAEDTPSAAEAEPTAGAP